MHRELHVKLSVPVCIVACKKRCARPFFLPVAGIREPLRKFIAVENFFVQRVGAECCGLSQDWAGPFRVQVLCQEGGQSCAARALKIVAYEVCGAFNVARQHLTQGGLGFIMFWNVSSKNPGADVFFEESCSALSFWCIKGWKTCAAGTSFRPWLSARGGNGSARGVRCINVTRASLKQGRPGLSCSGMLLLR